MEADGAERERESQRQRDKDIDRHREKDRDREKDKMKKKKKKEKGVRQLKCSSTEKRTVKCHTHTTEDCSVGIHGIES